MTHNLAHKHSQERSWQFKRAMELLALSGIKSGDTVLDIGRGTGHGTRELTLEIAKRVGPTGNVISVDIDESGSELAQQDIPHHIDNICNPILDVHHINLIPAHSVDVVFSNYVFHWVKDKSVLLAQIKRCLKPQGYLVAELVGELTLTLQAISAAAGSGGLAVLDKLCCHNLKQWEAYLTQAGFNINALSWPKHGYHFNSLNTLFDW